MNRAHGSLRGVQTGLALASLLLALLPAMASASAPSQASDAEATGCREVVVFSQPGCPHCTRARDFLEALRAQRPDIQVRIRDVAQDAAALSELVELSRSHGLGGVSVPAFSICGEFLIGYQDAETTGKEIVRALAHEPKAAPPADAIDLPFFERLSVEQVGLPAFTVLVGLVDGFNPCAMWVLLILLSILVGVHDRRKLFLIAGTFVLISGLAYFAFMAAWLNVFVLIGWSRSAQLAVAWIAVFVGVIHVKDFFVFGRGPSLSIPESAKPHIYRRIRRIVRADSLGAALGGAIVLAVLVNMVELLCTAGLPAIYTQILTLQGLTNLQYYGYLALYNLAYLFDDALMVGVTLVTLDRMNLQERAGRWLKALSGTALLVLGLVLLLRPDWLTPG